MLLSSLPEIPVPTQPDNAHRMPQALQVAGVWSRCVDMYDSTPCIDGISLRHIDIHPASPATSAAAQEVVAPA